MTRRLTATPYLFLVPALVLLGIFVLYPIGAVIYYSFTDFDIVTPPVPVGLENYQRLLGDDTFWLALTHSIIYLLVTPILIFLSIGLAIVVNRRLRGVSVFRALYFVLEGALNKLRYLGYGLAAILVFIGAKLGLHWAHKQWKGVPEVPTLLSLLVVVGILVVTTIASLVGNKVEDAHTDEDKEPVHS